MSQLTHIVGIDCATQPGNIGVCLATHRPGTLVVYRLFTCSATRPLAHEAAGWLRNAQHGLIALDAPLGWPQPLAQALASHQAGDAISAEANNMFRRETDRHIKATLDKVPLEVGANLIARTALAALKDLRAIAEALGQKIPLCWAPGVPEGIQAIEVYPAATRRAYEKAKCPWPRTIGVDEKVFLKASHTHDALLCARAAADFIEGCVTSPKDPSSPHIQQEGWIWVADVAKLAATVRFPSGIRYPPQAPGA